jgi:hypothetical protein
MADLSRKLDPDEAVKDPAGLFSSPMAVVNDPRLSKEDKQRILESWCRDAELMSQAEDENMGGTDRPRLQEVKLALQELEKRN